MNRKKKRIVWIDDDINTPILTPYVDEFEDNNFEIIKIESIDNLLPILKIEAKESLQAILVDIIMPYKHLGFGKTRGGLRTGLFVIKDILNEDSLKSIPIIAITNGDDTYVKNYIINNCIPYIEKKSYFSNELVAIVNKIIVNGKIVNDNDDE